MDAKVRDGSRLQDKRVAGLLVLGFLQNSAGHGCRAELQALRQELPGDDDQLQTDGNRCSRFCPDTAGTDSQDQEAAIRAVARQLAQIGDRMDPGVPAGLVDRLARRFMDARLSEEDRRTCLAAALGQLAPACPRDVEEDKATLVLVLLLARKVADHSPALLRSVFQTTVSFISHNLLACVRSLLRDDVD